jgi:hypothetical protein
MITCTVARAGQQQASVSGTSRDGMASSSGRAATRASLLAEGQVSRVHAVSFATTGSVL